MLIKMSLMNSYGTDGNQVYEEGTEGNALTSLLYDDGFRSRLESTYTVTLVSGEGVADRRFCVMRDPVMR